MKNIFLTSLLINLLNMNFALANEAMNSKNKIYAVFTISSSSIPGMVTAEAS